MPEYIPKARYPQELAQKVLDVQSQQPNLVSEAITMAGNVTGKYIDTKNKQKQSVMDKAEAAQLLKEQRTVDEGKAFEAQISDLMEKGYLELDADILKTLKPGESKAKAIKRWIPEKERRGNRSGQATKYNTPANEMRIGALEAMRNAQAKAEDPNAVPVKIDRKQFMSVDDVNQEIVRIKNSLEASGKTLDTIATINPFKKNINEAIKQSQESEDIIGAQPSADIKIPKEITALKSKAMSLSVNGVTAYDSIGKSAPEMREKTISNIQAKLTGGDAKMAEILYTIIKKEYATKSGK